MKKRPFLMASALVAGLFVFFLVLAVAVTSMLGRPTPQFTLGDKVGVVEVFGVIADSKPVIEQLHAFRDNAGVKAIVLRIDSPGGGVGPSQEIHDEVRALAQIKPVIASMASVAASGGYYIAAPANVIVANSGTITGSIGVVMQFTNFEELLEKIGLSNVTVKSGEHKDIGSPTRPMTGADRAILQSLIDDVHTQFVQSVAEGRGLDEQHVRELADGRIFTGRMAREMGLVDHLGNLEEAIRIAAKEGEIEGKPSVLYPPRKKPRFVDLFIEEAMNSLQQAVQRQRAVGLHYLWSGFH